MTTLTVTDLLRSVWRYKYVTIIAVALCTAAAIGGATLRPPEYEVRASLLLRFDNKYYAKNPISEGWEGDPVRVELANAVSTELAVLGSRSVLRATLRSVGGNDAWRAAEATSEGWALLAGYIKPFLDSLSAIVPALSATDGGPPAGVSEEQILDQIQERIRIKMAEGTSIATIEMKHNNRDFAVHFVSSLLQEYLAFRATLFPEVSVDKLAAQAADAKRRLLDVETELAQMKSKLGISDPDAERSALLSGKARIQAGESERATTRANPRQIENQRNLQLKLVDKRLAELEAADAAMMPLKLAVEQARGDADRANRAYQRARLSAETNNDQSIRVVDPATSADKPIGLGMAASALLGGLAGLGLSIMLAALDAFRRAGQRRQEQPYVTFSEYGWTRQAAIMSLPRPFESSIRRVQSEVDREPS